MRCDTCQKESAEVSRVVVHRDYNRLFSKPVYNCPECYRKKEETKRYNQSNEEKQVHAR
jgi:hypothetical protein